MTKMTNPDIPISYRALPYNTGRTRAVWALVSEDPCMTTQHLVEKTSYTQDQVNHALYALREAGYIDFDPRTKGGRTVLVPFISRRFKITKKG